jgi:pimeloyl-ACP methyl ester carboxylesterase
MPASSAHKSTKSSKSALMILAALSTNLVMNAAASASNPWEVIPIEERLPELKMQGRIEHDGASIWFATLGDGLPVILLHGGLASSDTWGNQIRPLVASHHKVVLVDTRGHGRSTLGDKPLGYERMATDVLAVMDALHIDKAAFVGWSDGANTSLVVAMRHPERATMIYAYGASMNLKAARLDVGSAPTLKNLGQRLNSDYARLSGTPGGWDALERAVRKMQKNEPNYSTAELAAIHGPRIAIADGDHEEFITRGHTDYLAKTIPGARLIILPGVSHFAPWQSPAEFNRSMIHFLDH